MPTQTLRPTFEVPPPDGGLRIADIANPATALGLAVSHLMGKPAFAGLRFGAWSRVLVGQINRGHYRIVADGRGRVRGFLGWVFCSEAAGEAWLVGRDFADGDDGDRDCILFNAWSAESPEANLLVLAAARAAMLDRRLAYFRRVYPNRTSRPMRMAVNAFVRSKLAPGGPQRGPAGEPVERPHPRPLAASRVTRSRVPAR